MLNIIMGTFVGFNLVFIECLIGYGWYKKSKIKRINRNLKKQ